MALVLLFGLVSQRIKEIEFEISRTQKNKATEVRPIQLRTCYLFASQSEWQFAEVHAGLALCVTLFGSASSRRPQGEACAVEVRRSASLLSVMAFEKSSAFVRRFLGWV